MGAITDLWVRWKMLRLPWRKKFLVGQDLVGNTYWEFRDALNHNRWRRMVRANRTVSHADVQISPQWHQWLRQTRYDPPSLQEQAADVQRQAALKHNARLADERWAAKARYIEKPKPTVTPQLSGDPQQDRVRAENMPGQPPQHEKTKSAVETPMAPRDDPWKKADETGSKPGAQWAPESWVPGASKR
ncbi:hypothetical protein LTR99_001867 [Exophiala xenobiotica]|uniref:NADH dehydrogenase [ubiquinone] 1 alpha subcomplex subunit n=1 Tax=Vermiconidia calcicola TaxID=1690605 RepID=A0AAV9Q5Y8_9PEZI|nr:hypothetical protein H2202_009418 [Exophiala xenobiotica]KAK5531088.1 hypothetical protein LTR23_010134 [Chaetothyriales sp. CCFEE 6169]KAK5536635.1 hypothetical protein LTR25_005309 [Vermiconidia calcicola]KAK5189585.1 hypothetical protein LTR92_010487 [Exophiala xenobiotica]KAK5212031.1 hypothetical protein LTR41_002273 [Exophiala xenobiotica]